MKNFSILLLTVLLFGSCSENNQDTQAEIIEEPNNLRGTWKMVYGEIRENDSLQIKDLTNIDFVKIINDNHFAFFNQAQDNPNAFYAGGGSYELNGNKYVETLSYTNADALKGHSFPFTIELKGDTLIQFGLEEVKEANIKRHIVEKYIRIN
ncbi:hypothetical protein [Marinigracilibium pacificum]|uniref:Lipocalin-like domain-containing protein n=1 Tax=Marinigracilibium pacificum TaxID=2729599 RepID=A0A848J4Z0_9BACT|nr:hypothetical protein [Marinigracilibium pacificum]NMM50841.1 hypothetical protein [Marinigracilibium pacificum]